MNLINRLTKHHGIANMIDALGKVSAHNFDVQEIEGTDLVNVKMHASDAYVAAEVIKGAVAGG